MRLRELLGRPNQAKLKNLARHAFNERLRQSWTTAPLFDLANLASNSNFDREQEVWLLHTYFGRHPDDRLLASFDAMKCASLMREVVTGWVCR